MFEEALTLNKTPFPHIVIDDFYDPQKLESLNKDFPSTLVQKSSLVGRKKLSKDDRVKNHVVLSNSWEQFLSELDSKQTCLSLMKIAKPFLLENARIDLNNNIKIYPSRVRKNCNNSVFFDYDISEGGDTYHREIHCDNPSRIINFLFHINDADCTGGELNLFSCNKDTVYKRRNPLNVDYVSSIAHKKNRMIVFVSNNYSYHSVTRITNTVIPRRFIYGSVTSCNPMGVWK